MDDLLGEVLGDRYQIQSLLGRQTGRRTFLAQDLEGDSPVILKLLLFGPDFSWDDLKLFEREAEVLKSLNHPAIPKYLDHFEVKTELGNGYVLVQSYIPAKSLQDWVKSGRTFSEEDLKAIAKEMLDILGYLHGRQPPVIHRDIKPSNILLGDRSAHSIGLVYLVDFGSVQTVVNPGTRTVVGTYGYMPPEQFGGKISQASDLFALGATLVYLATGEHPDQLPQKDFRIQFEDQVNLSNYFTDWIRKLIEPNLALRFKSTVEAIEFLGSSTAEKDSLFQLKSLPGSKIKIHQSLEAIDILIPPRGFQLDSILNLFVLPVFDYACVSSMSIFGGLKEIWLFGILPNLPWILLPIIAVVYLNLKVLCDWFLKKRLVITSLKLYCHCEIFGFKFFPQSFDRTDIKMLELEAVSYRKGNKGRITLIPPRINVWAGTSKLSFGGNSILTTPELVWVIGVLGDYLELPITDRNIEAKTNE